MYYRLPNPHKPTTPPKHPQDITRVLTTILVATTACTIYSAALFTNLATELLGPRGVRSYVIIQIYRGYIYVSAWTAGGYVHVCTIGYMYIYMCVCIPYGVNCVYVYASCWGRGGVRALRGSIVY